MKSGWRLAPPVTIRLSPEAALGADSRANRLGITPAYFPRVGQWRLACGFVVCAVTASCVAPTEETPGRSTSAYRMDSYLSDVVREFGEVPELRCEEGKAVPVTWQGQPFSEAELAAYAQMNAVVRTRDLRCDAPAIGNEEPHQCVPNSTLLKIETTHAMDCGETHVTWYAICTKDWPSWNLESAYHVVNVIAYNQDTDRMAFLRVIHESTTNSHGAVALVYANPVPAVDATSALGTTSYGEPNAKASMVVSECIECHSTGIRRNSFIRQLDEQGVPWVPHLSEARVKRLSILGATAKDVNGEVIVAKRLRPDNAPACVRCHQLPGGDRCERWLLHAFDIDAKGYSSFGGEYAGAGWHLPRFAKENGGVTPTLTQLKRLSDARGKSYGESYDAYLACCQAPETAGCWDTLPTP